VFVKDRAAAAASCERILAWDFVRVVPAHGAVREDSAAALLRAGLHWMLAATAALPPPR
jgi:hypothetical protein